MADGFCKMLSLTLVASIFFAAVAAEGELQILHSPDSIHFHGHERLSQDTMTEVLSAALGFTVQKSSNWQGLRILDPFSYSEAVVVLVVDGVASLESDLPHIHRYPLTTTEHEEDTWHALHHRIEERFPHEFHNNSVYRVDVQSIVAGEKSPLLEGVNMVQDSQHYEYLDPNVEEDAQLMKEIQVLRAVAGKVDTLGTAHDGLPDLYWFVVRGLHAVSDLHGPVSEATREAKKCLTDAASALSRAFSNAYGGDVTMVTMATDSSHTRRARSLLQESGATASSDLESANIAEEYSADFPVIFNIMLWFGITLTFTLLAVSVFIADMDPGRDSIIYRMTSTRMKKDN